MCQTSRPQLGSASNGSFDFNPLASCTEFDLINSRWVNGIKALGMFSWDNAWKIYEKRVSRAANRMSTRKLDEGRWSLEWICIAEACGWVLSIRHNYAQDFSPFFLTLPYPNFRFDNYVIGLPTSSVVNGAFFFFTTPSREYNRSRSSGISRNRKSGCAWPWRLVRSCSRLFFWVFWALWIVEETLVRVQVGVNPP